MAALTGPRNTPGGLGSVRVLPVAAATTIFAGGMVQVNPAGNAVPASATAANVTVGRADEGRTNSGAAGAETLQVRRGIFRYANSAAADLITRAHIGKPVYVVDDQTVAATSNTNARPVAGICFDVDAQGVWVDFA